MTLLSRGFSLGFQSERFGLDLVDLVAVSIIGRDGRPDDGKQAEPDYEKRRGSEPTINEQTDNGKQYWPENKLVGSSRAVKLFSWVRMFSGHKMRIAQMRPCKKAIEAP